ncbi:triose-phosphate transporter family-domain-containing protein [Irpex rosettiformis]|uniref:Triose-phosphate transporter family-domain-containing protein n=1 Tax=Irpex rosettiformis TaxID=378272 RepID=A0ACB8TPL3_9APHY|nr:triose-phosphate transporter family-domain-containing protein [Irpex rosettiformis]
MNGYSPSRQPGWTAYNALDTTATPRASWLADLLPSSYRQVLPLYGEERRSPSLLHRLRKTLFQDFPGFRSTRTATRSTLTSSQPESWLVYPSLDTVRFILLCACWYSSSALSSNTGKVILNQFRYPVTLTFVQFGFVAAFCLAFMSPVVQFTKLRMPTKAILRDTVPMGVFQVGGHIFSSIAIARIPVSTVHTIKALSPLFTVATYALLFGVSYSAETYMSLLPLTLGVMLACSFDISASNATGLLCAFGSALVFVSSNIFFKKIMPSSNGSHGGSSHKLDKLNLLFYSSSMAFLLMVPVWIWTDLPKLLPSSSGHVAHPPHPGPNHSSIVPYFIANGTVHFFQNVLAFVILARTSPVTYSIASLIKRVAVICAAVVWFSQRVHPVQAFGICLTFGGLYLYNRAVKKGDVDRGERKVRRIEMAWEGELPSTKDEVNIDVRQVAVTPIETYAQSPTTQQSHARIHLGSRPPPKSFSQTHPHGHPNLTVKTPTYMKPPAHVKLSKLDGVVPVESYPSPPLSDDEKPPASSGIEHVARSAKRRGTVSGHGNLYGLVDAPRVAVAVGA